MALSRAVTAKVARRLNQAGEDIEGAKDLVGLMHDGVQGEFDLFRILELRLHRRIARACGST